MSTGIYQIINDTNGKIYFGQSTNLVHRLASHKCNHGHNQHLTNSMNKYGYDSFTFDICFECPEDMLDVCEELLIYLLDTSNPDKGYNIERGGFGGKILHLSEKEICELYLTKKYYLNDLANKYNCSKPVISKILHDNLDESQIKEVISFQNKKRNNDDKYSYKDYPRLLLTKQHGKPQFYINFKGKTIKRSYYKNKLLKWFDENYPNEELRDEIKRPIKEITSLQNDKRNNQDKYKDYPRLLLTKKRGKPLYYIRYKSKTIKSSFYKDKVLKWFNENYPNEELRDEIKKQ